MLETHDFSRSHRGGASALVGNDEGHQQIASELERLLAEARPRLLRLARSQGVVATAADDVVQETLLEAWRSLARLREPEQFAAWLDGICRNVARRHFRSEGRNAALLEPFSSAVPAEIMETLPDPAATDLDEALSRQDLLTLLDHALGHLSHPTRELLALTYIAEVPREEAALRLGISPAALDVRVHRARQKLREVLSTDLRAEAESFGLPLAEEATAGWRETRIWCSFCGTRRLRSLFIAHADGRASLEMRCPHCSTVYGVPYLESGPADFGGVRSVLPAYKRTLYMGARACTDGLTGSYQPCAACGAEVHERIMHSDALAQPTVPDHQYIVRACHTCGLTTYCLAIVACWVDPAVRAFSAKHAHWVMRSDEPIDYLGTPALHFHLHDLTTAARLHIFAHPETYRVLATVEQ